MTYIVLDSETRRRLDKLCELAARRRIIQALLPNVPDTVVRAHWLHAQGEAPKKGPATTRPGSYYSTMKIRLHASFALAIYLDLELKVKHFVDAYTSAYEEYARTMDDPESFDWFFGLVQNYLEGMIDYVECDTCGANYVHNTDDLINDRNCPCHRILLSPAEAMTNQKEVIKPSIVVETDNDHEVEPVRRPVKYEATHATHQ